MANDSEEIQARRKPSRLKMMAIIILLPIVLCVIGSSSAKRGTSSNNAAKIKAVFTVKDGGSLWRISFQEDFRKSCLGATGKMIQELRVSNLRLGNGMAESTFVPGNPPKPISVGEKAPDWTLRDASGMQHRLSDYHGQIVVLNFWASWCGYCKLGIAAVQKIYEKYRARRVAVLGLSFQEADEVEPMTYLKIRGADFPAPAKGETVAGSYGVEGVPAYYVIDPNGKVAYAALEYYPNVPPGIKQSIEKLLRERPVR